MPAFGNADAEVNNQISRYDFAQILACSRQLAVIRPVRVLYDSSNVTGLVAGTLVAQNTGYSAAGSASAVYPSLLGGQYFQKYVQSGVSGTGTPVAVLLTDVVPASGDSVLAPAVFSGAVYKTMIPNWDSTVAAALVGRTWTDSNPAANTIFKF